MKKILTLVLIGIIPVFLFGQVPQAFNYQAVVRTAAGEVIHGQNVNFQIQLIRNDSVVYSENFFNWPTGPYGIVNLKVGTGQTSDDFSQIKWDWGQHKIKVWVDGAPIGEADIVSVPYALYAEKSGSGGSEWINVGDTLLVSNDKNARVEGALEVTGDYLSIIGINGATSLIQFSDPTTNAGNMKFYGPNGNQTIGLGVLSSSEPNKGLITIKNDDGENRISLYVADDGNGKMVLYGPNGNANFIFDHGSNPNQGAFTVRDENGVSKASITIDSEGNGNLNIQGRSTTRCLEITGGCDITEPFEMSTKETYPSGSLVIIDSENAGKLTISTQAYDKRIAGVISGAGGINPGISLQQEGVLDNGQPVTLAGRVYVLASAVNGAIQPGDLLTTSNIPGYAMKATSKNKRQGAVIGKAMSELKEGEGLVLVLVNLF